MKSYSELRRHAVAAGAMLIAASSAFGDEYWTTTGGATTIAFDVARLAELGISCTTVDSISSAAYAPDPWVTLEVDPASALTFAVSSGNSVRFIEGELRHRQGLDLVTADHAHLLDRFPIRLTGNETAPLSGERAADATGRLLFGGVAAAFDPEQELLLARSATVAIPRGLAETLGNPALAGEIIGSIEIRADAAWSGGDIPAKFDERMARAESRGVCTPHDGNSDGAAGLTQCCATTGPDAIMGDLSQVGNYTAVGNIEAFSIGISVCNIGDQTLPWVASSASHPVIAQNLYRLKDGHMEQIGMGWLYHTFIALASSSCGCSCIPPGSGFLLGIGCSDPSSAALVGSQSGLGPRFEVDAHTGVFSYPFTGSGATGDAIFKRLQVRIDDIDPGLAGGGTYFLEAQAVTPDDAATANQDNNASYRQVDITGSGASWTGSFAGMPATVREQPALRAWKNTDPSVVETDARVPGEGLMVLAAKPTNLGGGTWHYEYALQNVNSHRGGQSFTVPFAPGTAISNVGFHDVDYHDGDGHGGVTRDNTDWLADIYPGNITWSTDTFDVNSNANALLFGTTYNFWFDADAPPDAVEVTIGLFRGIGAASFTAMTVGPQATLTDCQPNGIADDQDIAAGTSQDCNTNGTPDECEVPPIGPGPDCNTNGIPDDCDIAGGTSSDCDGNGISDECQPDSDGDGIPDRCDLLEPAPTYPPPGAPHGLVSPASGSFVELFSGEFCVSAVDLRIRGRGPDFIWARKYRSRIGPDTASGYRWDFGYNIHITAGATNELVVHDGNTRVDAYSLFPDGTWQKDGFFRVLSRNPDGTYTLEFADTGKWMFNALDGSPAAGKVRDIVDRNGNMLMFDYDAQGRLTTIHDTLDGPAHNRDITIGYNSNGLIASVTDWTGRQVAYAYYDGVELGGSAGDLKSVTSPAVTGTPTGNDFPAGKTTVYTYSTGFADERLNHNLLTITDPKGQTRRVNTYAATQDSTATNFDRVVGRVVGDPGDLINYAYVPQTPGPGNNQAVIKTIVNDRMGNVREHFCDEGNHRVIRKAYTGRAPDPDAPTTDVANRPTGKLRPADPDVFETQWTYNADSLVTRIDHPNDNATVFFWAWDFDPQAARRSRGNLRQRRRLPGPLGGFQGMIDEFFTYHPTFNFVATHTDPRGNVTSNGFDAAGNRIHTRHRIPTVVEDWEFNSNGQVTAHILPDNGSGSSLRDEFTYYEVGPSRGHRRSRIVDVGGFALTTTYQYDGVGNLTQTADPRNHDTQYVVNALDQVVRRISREVIDSNGVRYEWDFYYDANDNRFRIDVQNIDDAGVLQSNTHFTTIYEYDILDRVTRTCAESGSLDVPPGQSDCTGLPAAEFVTTEYAYDANRHRTLVRSPEAVSGGQPTNVVRTLYDERDLVFQVIQAEGDPDQSTTQIDYDSNGNPTTVYQGLEDTPRITTRVVDGYDRLIDVIDPMGNMVMHGHDANGNIISTRVDGEMTDVPGSAGNVRLYETGSTYDFMDRRTQRETAFFDAAGQIIGDGLATTTWTWTDTSQIGIVTNDNLHATTRTYDTANRRSVVTDAAGNTTTYGYDASSNVTSVVRVDKSDLGNPDQAFTTVHMYDNLNRRIDTIDNVGSMVMYGHDSRHNRTVTIDALGRETRHVYDGLDRIVKTVRDMNGDGANMAAVPGDADPDIVTTRMWDRNSRLVDVADDNNHMTMYMYDPLDRIIDEGYADGTMRVYTYDVHHNRVTGATPNGTVVIRAHDLNNRLTGKTITPGPGVANATTFETYEWDGVSRCVSATDDNSTVTRAYDSLSHLTAETLVIGNGPGQTSGTTSHTTDGVGNLLSLTYPGGRVITRTYDALERTFMVTDTTDVPATLADYFYVGHRIERRDLGNGTRTDTTYDGITGVPNPPGDFGVGRIIETLHSRIAGGAALDHRTYAWDRAGNKTQRQDLLAAMGGQQGEEFTHDDADRLVHTLVTDPAMTVLRETDYTLDGVGNRQQITENGVPGFPTSDRAPEVQGPGWIADVSAALEVPRNFWIAHLVFYMDPAVPPADAQVNQYSVTPADHRTYDDNGNLIRTSGFADSDGNGVIDDIDYAAFFQCLSGPGTEVPVECRLFDCDGNNAVELSDMACLQQVFGSNGAATPPAVDMKYDYRDRMVEYLDVGTGQRHTYAYDCFGRRIARKVDADGAAVETRYFYGGEGPWWVIEEQDGAGVTQASYVAGLITDRDNHRIITDSGNDRVLMTRGGTDYYYHGDDLGNVTAVSNAAGSVVERYQYRDYGEPTIFDQAGATIPQSAIANPFMFRSQRFDDETGLYLNESSGRYYEPATGRTTSRGGAGASTAWGSNPTSGRVMSFVDIAGSGVVDRILGCPGETVLLTALRSGRAGPALDIPLEDWPEELLGVTSGGSPAASAGDSQTDGRPTSGLMVVFHGDTLRGRTGGGRDRRACAYYETDWDGARLRGMGLDITVRAIPHRHGGGGLKSGLMPVPEGLRPSPRPGDTQWGVSDTFSPGEIVPVGFAVGNPGTIRIRGPRLCEMSVPSLGGSWRRDGSAGAMTLGDGAYPRERLRKATTAPVIWGGG